MILPDVLKSGLYVVFCGTAAGNASAARSAYYAGRGNRFWPTLHATGLTPHRFQPEQYASLLELRIGLTDLAQNASGSDSDLQEEDFDVAAFKVKIRDHSPINLAFNGKNAARIALDKDQVDYGRQSITLHGANVWVLPSTSGRNASWDEAYWRQLADEYMRLKALNR